MDWTRQIDAYCERTDMTWWAEPWNAVSNLAFLVAAIWMWRACSDAPGGRVLAAILFVIGIGSFLWHTYAAAWAGAADVLPILIFILVYLYLVNRDIIGLGAWSAGLATALFLPYAAGVATVLETRPFFRISGLYWSVPLLILVYALGIVRAAPRTARGMIFGALILCLSITLRSLDETLCPQWPLGTHPAWHLLNAVMLAWMIEVYRRFREPVFPD